VSQPLIWDVVDFMRRMGFVPVDLLDIHRWRRINAPAHPYRSRATVSYSRGELAQCDVVMLRSPETLKTNVQALRLMIVGAALGYFDIAISVLRARPALGVQIHSDHGIDASSALIEWSELSGIRCARQSVRSHIRDLVPMVKSMIGCLGAGQRREHAP